jgi:hypothetical protein
MGGEAGDAGHVMQCTRHVGCKHQLKAFKAGAGQGGRRFRHLPPWQDINPLRQGNKCRVQMQKSCVARCLRNETDLCTGLHAPGPGNGMITSHLHCVEALLKRDTTPYLQSHGMFHTLDASSMHPPNSAVRT